MLVFGNDMLLLQPLDDLVRKHVGQVAFQTTMSLKRSLCCLEYRFGYADDYSFGILQSAFHWTWFINRCSTLKGDPRYTSNTVFDTFPWPQSPTSRDIERVATAAIGLRNARRFLLKDSEQTLRALYRELEKPGKHPLKDAHAELDLATRNAYGFGPNADMLKSLLDLNRTLAEREAAKNDIIGPGLPASIKHAERLISKDRYRLSV